jgi:hypothetical protein
MYRKNVPMVIKEGNEKDIGEEVIELVPNDSGRPTDVTCFVPSLETLSTSSPLPPLSTSTLR